MSLRTEIIEHCEFYIKNKPEHYYTGFCWWLQRRINFHAENYDAYKIIQYLQSISAQIRSHFNANSYVDSDRGYTEKRARFVEDVRKLLKENPNIFKFVKNKFKFKD